jgi:regulator of protease activity HflC (stomatin/prohibitin superfamily)
MEPTIFRDATNQDLPPAPPRFDPRRLFDGGFNPRRLLRGGLWIAGCAVLIWVGTNQFEHMNADEVMVIQSPIRGTLTWYKDAGLKWQGFGRVTKYHKRSQFWFSKRNDQGTPQDESIKARFNDGGHASISGSIAWEMPIDDRNLTAVHTRYGSEHAVEQQLVRTVVEKAVYMTGPLMSSKESYAERRNELLQYIEDQVQNGVYKTETRQERVPDPMTAQLKTVNVVSLVKDGNGQILRSDESPLRAFGIRTFNPSINQVSYDETVESQIKQQQQAIMDVQTAVANAKKAEQDAITAAKNGEAAAAKAKWEQEVEKARAVTEAQQKLEVAKLDAQAAEQNKKKNVLEGEGEATKRQLIMNADGALDKKLATYLEVQRVYADAIKGYQGDWVPSVVMGGQGQAGAGSGAMTLIELLGAKAAIDMGLDLKAGGAAKTRARQ